MNEAPAWTDWLNLWSAIFAAAAIALGFAYWLVRKWREERYDDAGDDWDHPDKRS